MLCNQQVWSNIAQPCNVYGYKASVVNEPGLAEESGFLIRNHDGFTRQLDCMINTTVFETDLAFLDTCVNKLENLYSRVTNSGSIIYPALPIVYAMAG